MDTANEIGGPTGRFRQRMLRAESSRLPEARALADRARAAAERSEWVEAASFWRRASFLVRHLPLGIEWRQESRFADQLAREATEEIAFDRPALRTLLGLPA